MKFNIGIGAVIHHMQCVTTRQIDKFQNKANKIWIIFLFHSIFNCFAFCLLPQKRFIITFLAKHREMMISEILHLNSFSFFFLWETLINRSMPISCSTDDLSISINKSQWVLIFWLLLLPSFPEQRHTRNPNTLYAFDGVCLTEFCA